MLANGAKETTTTTGTGTVTLSAVTGFPRFSDILGVGTLVDYAIRSGNNWEWGFGTLAAGNTLDRSVVLAKYESGAYSKNPVSGVSLSGTSEVFCTAHSAVIAPTIPAIPQRGSLSRHVYNGIPANNRARTNQAFGGGRVMLYPFQVELRCRVTKVGVSAGASVAGAQCRAGMYAMNADGSPGPLLFESGVLDPVTSGTDYLNTITEYDLLPGWYWACIQSGTTGPNLYCFETGNGPQASLGVAAAGLPIRGLQYWKRDSVTFAALPADASSFGITSSETKTNDSKQPMIILEVV